MISTFLDQESEYYNYIKSINETIRLVGFNDFRNLVLIEMVKEPNLLVEQKVTLRQVGEKIPVFMNDGDVNNFLMYILYGTFSQKEPELDSYGVTPLSLEQRAFIVKAVMLVCRNMIQAHINDLQILQNYSYDLPEDWHVMPQNSESTEESTEEE